MANAEQKTFHCDLIDPTGRLLDCETTSVVLPAHDGQLGILYDHMPMLCQLGLGVMKVASPCGPATPPPSAGSAPNDLFFFIDGGFALVAQNTVTVVAYDAAALQGVQAQEFESLLAKTAKSAADPALSPERRAHESERLRALQRIAESRRSA
jgi:F-type H+-transporting ATPase subunit epsilon